MRPAIMHHTSKEYLRVGVTAPTGVVLSAQAVAFSIVGYGSDPDSYAAAQWDPTQAADNTRDAVLLIGQGTSLALVEGDYEVWVRVTDNPEIPVRSAGLLRVT
jgi:hypothetical protein